MTTTASNDPTLPTAALWFVPAAMLLVALGDAPGGYYTLLRLVVCAACVLAFLLDYALRGGLSGWAIVLVLMAVLFNPVVQIRLSREDWAPIDVASAMLLAIHYLACRRLVKRTRRERAQPAEPHSERPRRPVGQQHEAPLRRKDPVNGNLAPHPHTDANTLVPQTRLKEYEIVRVLGAGRFGITYLAFDQHLNVPVALKEYFCAGLAVRRSDGTVASSSTRSRKDFDWGLARFLGEAQLLSGLSHPNIVRVRRYFQANNTAYIVMDYVEGESLAAFLEKHLTLTPAQWRPWLEALLDGLEHVHDRG